MKNLVMVLSILLWGCVPDQGRKHDDDQCYLGGDTYKCDPENLMQVIYEAENLTDRPVLLSNPIDGLPDNYPDGQGDIPHHLIELQHLNRTYFIVPANGKSRLHTTNYRAKMPPSQFSASILFTDDLLQCLSEDAYDKSVYNGDVTYDLSPGRTLICSEEQLISLLINYYRVTEDNFSTLSEQATGRPFTLTYTDEMVPFEDRDGEFRRITYHYQVIRSQ